jgi:hypothetical protein
MQAERVRREGAAVGTLFQTGEGKERSDASHSPGDRVPQGRDVVRIDGAELSDLEGDVDE